MGDLNDEKRRSDCRVNHVTNHVQKRFISKETKEGKVYGAKRVETDL